jgi:hypothetical protein
MFNVKKRCYILIGGTLAYSSTCRDFVKGHSLVVTDLHFKLARLVKLNMTVPKFSYETFAIKEQT